jgi:hypothetical protein
MANNINGQGKVKVKGKVTIKGMEKGTIQGKVKCPKSKLNGKAKGFPQHHDPGVAYQEGDYHPGCQVQGQAIGALNGLPQGRGVLMRGPNRLLGWLHIAIFQSYVGDHEWYWGA